jgi:hypothetical protein
VGAQGDEVVHVDAAPHQAVAFFATAFQRVVVAEGGVDGGEVDGGDVIAFAAARDEIREDLFCSRFFAGFCEGGAEEGEVERDFSGRAFDETLEDWK